MPDGDPGGKGGCFFPLPPRRDARARHTRKSKASSASRPVTPTSALPRPEAWVRRVLCCGCLAPGFLRSVMLAPTPAMGLRPSKQNKSHFPPRTAQPYSFCCCKEIWGACVLPPALEGTGREEPKAFDPRFPACILHDAAGMGQGGQLSQPFQSLLLVLPWVGKGPRGSKAALAGRSWQGRGGQSPPSALPVLTLHGTDVPGVWLTQRTDGSEWEHIYFGGMGSIKRRQGTARGAGGPALPYAGGQGACCSVGCFQSQVLFSGLAQSCLVSSTSAAVSGVQGAACCFLARARAATRYAR